MSQNNNTVEIYDTTLRDGTQAEGISLSVEDKLMIADKLDALGIDYIEGGYPLSNPKDRAFFEAVAARPPGHAKIAAFGMTRRRGSAADDDLGLQALLDSEAPVITLVGKSWDLHVREVLRAEPDENLAMIADSVGRIVRAGREAIYDAEHFFDGYRANPDYALRTVAAAVEAGAPCVVLCDTNGGSLPDAVRAATEAVVRRFDGVRIGVHCHNDANLAVANSLAAVAAGARHVQGTINGIGERCGNADLTSVIPLLVLKCGYACHAAGAMERLTEVSRYVYEMANLSLRDNQPFVGMAAFAHKGGMHVHAVQRNVSTYEHIDPAAVGNRRRILISELAGATNVAVLADKRFNLQADKALQRRVLEAVQDRENAGYQYEAAEASFELLIRRLLGGKWHRRFWELAHYRCVILTIGSDAPTTEAIVKMRVGDEPVHTVAEGDGPVNALDAAMRKALQPFYPTIDGLHLADYKVRVVNPRAGTAAKVCVVIEFHDDACGYFGTVGVDENIIHASWEALADAIEFKLLNERENDTPPADPHPA